MVLGQIQCHDVSVSYKTSILVFTTNLLSPHWPCHGFTLANVWHFPGIFCPDPHLPNGRPLHSWQVKEVYEYGNRLEVACSEGFAFKGRDSSITLRCTHDGSWEPAVPECIPGETEWTGDGDRSHGGFFPTPSGPRSTSPGLTRNVQAAKIQMGHIVLPHGKRAGFWQG